MNKINPSIETSEEQSMPEETEPLEPEKSLVVVSESDDGDSRSKLLFSWLFGIFQRNKNQELDRDELADVFSGNGKAFSDFSTDEREMLSSILRLRDTRVVELMVPRAEIIAVPEVISLAELLTVFEDTGHSRMPVYGETLDDPKGMVHIRDVVAYLIKTARLTKSEATKRKKSLPANLDLKKVQLAKSLSEIKVLRELMYIPPSMRARELMARLQAERMQIALVIDEYGGTDGIISLEDIVEEIVGEIEDEHDDEEDLIQEKSAGSFTCDAKAELDDIREHIGKDFAFGEHEEDIETIGGLIFDILGRVPVRGEIIKNNGFEFHVLDADPRRVKRVELMRTGRRRTRKA